MPFSVSWSTIINEADDLPPGATLVTPLSKKRFTVNDVQDHRIVIGFQNQDESRPLQREQFEALYRRIQEYPNGFDLDNIPPGAEPYAAVWTLHPRFEVDESAGVITEIDGPTTTQVVNADGATDEASKRSEPERDVYSDALLLIDALERHEISQLDTLDTNALVNLYILLSDVQRDANTLRQDIADVLLNRVHHDQPVPGQYGSVQRTRRRNKSLKEDEEVLSVLEDAGIDQERVLGVDPDKVDEALEVTELTESEVYDVEETEYVRKAEVDEEVRETRLQGLKDRLKDTEGDAAQELRQEIEELETRIEELTEFKSGQEFHSESGVEP